MSTDSLSVVHRTVSVPPISPPDLRSEKSKSAEEHGG